MHLDSTSSSTDSSYGFYASGTALAIGGINCSEKGWPVHPCVPGGKHPILTDWPNLATTDREIVRQWWVETPTANIGIVTGERSGFWVLDVDGPQGVEDLDKLEALHSKLPKTRVVCTPSGGGHYYWKMPTDRDVRNRAGINGMSIDVRGSGGYVIGHLGQTPKGEYTLSTQAEIVPAPDWLIELVAPVVKAAPPPPPDDRLPFRQTAGTIAYDRAGKYLDAMPLADGTGGQRGHDATFAAARACYTGFALDTEQTYQLLRDRYNPRCNPPWCDGELRHKAQSAADTPSKYPRGYLLHAERNGQSTPSGKFPEQGQPPEPVDDESEWLTDEQFASGDFRPDWFIKNVLTKGEPCGIGAPMKALKTSTSIDMAISLATATPFLGTFDVPHPATVAIVSGESGKPTLQKVRERVLNAKGYGHDFRTERLHWRFDTPCLSDVPKMTKFVAGLAKRSVEVAILDPLYLMLGDVDAANIFQAGGVLRNVGMLLISHGITPVILHHARKILPVGQPMELQDLSHSGFAEFVRQYILINRMAHYQHDGRHSLNMRIGGSAGHGGEYAVEVDEGILNPDDFSGRKWEVNVTNKADVPKATGEDRDAKKTAKRKADASTKIAKFLDDIDTECATGVPAITKSKLKKPYGWQHADINDISESLLIDGVIELHEFEYTAGKGAKQTAIGFRRPIPQTQSEIEFPINRLENDQPVFSDDQPVEPVDPVEGGLDQRINRLGFPPIGGNPPVNRLIRFTPSKTGRRRRRRPRRLADKRNRLFGRSGRRRSREHAHRTESRTARRASRAAPVRDPITRNGYPPRDADYRLKLALKTLLRSYGLKCVTCRDVKADPTAGTGDAGDAGP